LDTYHRKGTKVQVGHNSNHLFTCIQFLIQRVVARTIHCAQSLLLMDNLTFDPHGVFWHGLTYKTWYKIRTKENPYLHNPLQQKLISVDVMVRE